MFVAESRKVGEGILIRHPSFPAFVVFYEVVVFGDQISKMKLGFALVRDLYTDLDSRLLAFQFRLLGNLLCSRPGGVFADRLVSLLAVRSRVPDEVAAIIPAVEGPAPVVHNGYSGFHATVSRNGRTEKTSICQPASR